MQRKELETKDVWSKRRMVTMEKVRKGKFEGFIIKSLKNQW